MIDSVAVGTTIRVTTDKWDGVGFGPEKGEIAEVVIADYTQADELAVRLSDGVVYYVKAGEFEVLEDAAFQPGDRVRVVSSPDPLVEVGTEGVVMSKDDRRLFMAILIGGEPPADLNVVDLGGGFIGLKNNELELIERVEDAGVNNTAGVDREASEPTPVVPQPDFAVGTQVRVIDNSAAQAVQIGDEGNVIDRDDEQVSAFTAALAPEELVFVVFPGQTDLAGGPLVQVFHPDRLERVEQDIISPSAAIELGSDPNDAPVGTHVILTTDIFKPYYTGDRGVVVKIGAYHVVEMYDGGELYLDRSEFVISEGQPEAEKELIAVAPEEPTAAPLFKRDEYVAFELTDVSWGKNFTVQILNIGDQHLHLVLAHEGGQRLTPKLSAAERLALGTALIESAGLGE